MTSSVLTLAFVLGFSLLYMSASIVTKYSAILPRKTDPLTTTIALKVKSLLPEQRFLLRGLDYLHSECHVIHTGALEALEIET